MLLECRVEPAVNSLRIVKIAKQVMFVVQPPKHQEEPLVSHRFALEFAHLLNVFEMIRSDFPFELFENVVDFALGWKQGFCLFPSVALFTVTSEHCLHS